MKHSKVIQYTCNWIEKSISSKYSHSEESGPRDLDQQYNQDLAVYPGAHSNSIVTSLFHICTGTYFVKLVVNMF